MQLQSSEYVIRPAEAADADTAAGMHAASMLSAYQGVLSDQFLDTVTESNSAKYLRRAISDPGLRVLIAERSGVVGGIAMAGVPFREEAPEGFDTQTFGEFRTIYISPDLWGSGLASQLHDANLESLNAMGYSRAYLWVIRENHRAMRFYLRHGWVSAEVSAVREVMGSTFVEQLMVFGE